MRQTAPNDRSVRRGRRGVLSARAALVVALGIRAAFADGVSGYVELQSSRGETTLEDPSGARAQQEVREFLQRYRLDFTRRFFPNLELRLGGVYEHEDVKNTIDASVFESRRRRAFPFLRLSLRGGMTSTEVGYERRDDRVRGGAAVAQLTEDTYRLNFAWNPEDLPQTRVEYVHRDIADLDQRGLDTRRDTINLNARYLVREKVDLYYRGALEWTDDKLASSSFRTNFQTMRASYSEAWRDRKLLFSTDYTVNWRDTQVTRAGTGEIVFPVVPTAGLFAIDDTPDRGALPTNPALVDGDRLTPAGIDLGLPGPGEDDRPRNMGLDLGFPSELNTILVWTDRELTAAIASTFSWRLYTSADNVDWTLQQVIPSAAFGPFENRFEVRFSARTVRYVKLVVAPLAASVPDASTWPEIQVTELEPQLRRPASDLQLDTAAWAHLVNADFRARLTDTPLLYYELGTFLSSRTNAATLYTISNGLSVPHPISTILTGAARLTREDRHEALGDQTAYLFSGSLTATPFDTLQESLVVSSVRESGEFGRNSSAVILSTIAEIYRGISGNLSLGRSRVTPNSGGDSLSRDLTLGLTFVPHPTFTVNTSVQNRHVTLDSPFAGYDRRDDLDTGEVGVSYRPIRSLYLFASLQSSRSNQTGTRTLRDWSASWTPFPDGTLRLSVFYDSSYRAESGERQQTLVPSLRWAITPRMYLNVSYQDLETDSLAGFNSTHIATSTFVVAF